MPKLTIYARTGNSEIALDEYNLIGRNTNNRITILDPSVSSVHCLIEFEGNQGFVIRDLSSLNGTFVNNKRIDGKAILHDNDEILIGSTRCIYSTDNTETVVQIDHNNAYSLSGRRETPKAEKMQSEFLHECQIPDEVELRTDYEKLRITYEMQRDIGFDTNIDMILERILDRTFEFLNCDRGIFLIENKDRALKPRAYKTTKQDDKFVISSTLIKLIRKTKAGIRSTDALNDDRLKTSRSIVIQGTRSILAVPILDQNNLIGILIIESSVEINAFAEKDLRLLTNIANQTAQFIKNSRMAKKIKRDEITRKQFQRLLSPNLAEMVVSGKLMVEKGGESRIATVLFTDIRGFSVLSENIEATGLLQMLNDFFEVIVDIVFHYEGTVDKFIGDAMMAIWGAPMAHEDDPYRAVKAGIEIQNLLLEFNKTRAAEGQQQIQIGIGISTGNLVAGYIGSSQTMSYSVIGGTVNDAYMLCSSAGPGQVLISENTYKNVKSNFEIKKIDPVPAKGKAKSIKAYSVLGLDLD